MVQIMNDSTHEKSEQEAQQTDLNVEHHHHHHHHRSGLMSDIADWKYLSPTKRRKIESNVLFLALVVLAILMMIYAVYISMQ
jgi:hypothetical protein